MELFLPSFSNLLRILIQIMHNTKLSAEKTCHLLYIYMDFVFYLNLLQMYKCSYECQEIFNQGPDLESCLSSKNSKLELTCYFFLPSKMSSCLFDGQIVCIYMLNNFVIYSLIICAILMSLEFSVLKLKAFRYVLLTIIIII